MSDLNYPDHFYADKQKPTGAYDARKLGDASSTDKLRTAFNYLGHAKRLIEEFIKDTEGKPAPIKPAPKWSPQWLADNGIPVESAYLASMRETLTAEELKGFGIGDVERRHVAEKATTVAISQHPAMAEVIRDHDERLDGPEDRL